MPCVICGFEKSDPHHLGHARHRDDFAVNLCRKCHIELHSFKEGNETDWWSSKGINILAHLINNLFPLFEKEAGQRNIVLQNDELI